MQASGAVLMGGSEVGKGILEIVPRGNTTNSPWPTGKLRAAAWVKLKEARP